MEGSLEAAASREMCRRRLSTKVVVASSLKRGICRAGASAASSPYVWRHGRRSMALAAAEMKRVAELSAYAEISVQALDRARKLVMKRIGGEPSSWRNQAARSVIISAGVSAS